MNQPHRLVVQLARGSGCTVVAVRGELIRRERRQKFIEVRGVFHFPASLLVCEVVKMRR